jgi:hypothetical protein
MNHPVLYFPVLSNQLALLAEAGNTSFFLKKKLALLVVAGRGF